jgi:RecA DNA recombination protein
LKPELLFSTLIIMAASASQIAEVLAGMRAESARIVSAAEQPARARLPTGSAALDALTGGGLVRGRILEVSGPRSSGRMSMVMTMAAAVQAAGELVAVVDVADALDPRSAARAGVVLPRLLWVRPKSVVDGLKAADWILDAGGFGLVALYLAGSDARAVQAEAKTSWRRRQSLVRGEAPWIRLARRAERAKSALVVVADRPLVGTVAAVSLAAERGRVRWLGGERGAPRILDGVNGRIVVARSKLGPPTGSADLPLDVAAGE